MSCSSPSTCSRNSAIWCATGDRRGADTARRRRPTLRLPIGLVQPKVLYEFADPELEARSAGQKIMIRMGNAKEQQTKAVLRAIRNEVTRRAIGK